jgi:hypothetical protein
MLMRTEGSTFYAVYIFSCINISKTPDDGSLLEPKHVAVNKLIKTSYLYRWFETYTCDQLRCFYNRDLICLLRGTICATTIIYYTYPHN